MATCYWVDRSHRLRPISLCLPGQVVPPAAQRSQPVEVDTMGSRPEDPPSTLVQGLNGPLGSFGALTVPSSRCTMHVPCFCCAGRLGLPMLISFLVGCWSRRRPVDRRLPATARSHAYGSRLAHSATLRSNRIGVAIHFALLAAPLHQVGIGSL